MTKIHVSVVEAFSHDVRAVELWLDAGASVADALSAPGILEAFPDAENRPFGIHAHRADNTATLHDGDRIELYRPLIADAKKNRMERVAQQRGTRNRTRQ